MWDGIESNISGQFSFIFQCSSHAGVPRCTFVGSLEPVVPMFCRGHPGSVWVKWCSLQGLRTWVLTAQLCQLHLGVKALLWCPPPAKEVFVHSLALCILYLYVKSTNPSPWDCISLVLYPWLSTHRGVHLLSGICCWPVPNGRACPKPQGNINWRCYWATGNDIC